MATCLNDEPCFLNKANQEALQKINCQLHQMLHKVNCCSTRIRASNLTPCHCAGEVTAEEMKEVLSDLGETVRKLQTEVEKHGHLHQMRTNRGRATQTASESGYGSGQFRSLTLSSHAPVEEEQSLPPEVTDNHVTRM